MVTDEMLLKMMIRAYAYMRRNRDEVSNDNELMTLKTKGYSSILDLIAENDSLTQRQIAELSQMRQQSASEALASLEKRGYITRTPSPTDKRISLIHITEEGKTARTELKEQREKMAASYFGCLSKQEKESLYAILVKLVEG